MTSPPGGTFAVDFSQYQPPGVYMNPTPGPQLGVNTNQPTAVALFGQTLGYMSYVQTVQIQPDTNDTTPAPTQTLAFQGINTATVVVANPSTGSSYTLNSDYTIVLVGGTANTSDSQYAIQRVIGGNLSPTDFIQVSYQYTDSTYYQPYIFYTYSDVVAAYGAPWNLNTGTLQSELTLAAQFAFLNGAYQVVCVAVRSSTTPGNATVGDYGTALNSLQDQPLVAIVVPCTGQQPLFQLVQEHVDQQSANRFERRAIIGLDGTVVPVPSSQRIVDAQAISDSRVMLVCPATFTYFSPELNQSVTIGGQFMAACLAAITISQAGGWAMPLTRKIPAGWTSVAELELSGQKNLESQNGLCVIEQTRTGTIQVRHGLSTDSTSLVSREWSIIGQQDAMVYTLRAYLESDNLIGQPIYLYTLQNVLGSAEAALQTLIVGGQIVDYTGLAVRQLITNPDVLEVQFQWLPAWPLNYIVCTFSITLSAGTANSTTGTTVNQNNITNSTSTSLGSSSPVISTPSGSTVNDFGGPTNTLQSTTG
jgi:hypothetical protein